MMRKVTGHAHVVLESNQFYKVAEPRSVKASGFFWLVNQFIQLQMLADYEYKNDKDDLVVF